MKATAAHCEYCTKKVLMLRAGRRGQRAQEKLLNQMASRGWELVDAKRRGTWDFGNKDVLTFRRPR